MTEIQPGTRVGNYQVQELIGFGASAIVHKAWHPELDRPVAIKFLPSILDAQAMARFSREARALRRLDHPNIVQVLDTGEQDGTPFMVFDLIEGGSLAERIEAEPKLSLGEALRILDGIAKGLDHAHGRGIVHRDVKPANILLGRTGTPVIADFGLARVLEQPALTAAGVLFGTPAYMAPEQAEGKPVTTASDQYSLAAIAYEMLTGQAPFPGETITEVLTGLLTRDAVAPSRLKPGLSPAVDAALLRGLSKDPAQRWSNCQALTDAILAAMVNSLPQLAAAAKAAAPAASDSEPAPAGARASGEARVRMLESRPGDPYLTIVVPYREDSLKKVKSRRIRVYLLAAVGVLIAAVAGGAVFTHGALLTMALGH
jgi:serine/threonine-protein kinase